MRSEEERLLDELADLPYYHHSIDSSKAVQLLRHERPGTFLLRKNIHSHHKGAFTISVIKNRTEKRTDIFHFVVLGHPGCYYAKKDMIFARIVDLIEYYKLNDYENHLDIRNIRLTHALINPSYVSPYSYATVGNRLEQLINHLTQLDEQTDEELCECGIRVKDAELPDGWMIHKTQSDNPAGQPLIFFQHNGLNLTQWDVPHSVLHKMSREQRNFIRRWGVKL